MQHVILPPCVKQLRADRFRLFRSFHSKHPVCTRLLLSPAQEPLLRTHGFYLHTETPRERPIRPAEVTHTDTHTHTYGHTHTDPETSVTPAPVRHRGSCISAIFLQPHHHHLHIIVGDRWLRSFSNRWFVFFDAEA